MNLDKRNKVLCRILYFDICMQIGRLVKYWFINHEKMFVELLNLIIYGKYSNVRLLSTHMLFFMIT